LFAQECAYAEYYNLTSSAKKNYSEKNYKEAEKNLKLAFSKTNFPLGKDLELALSVAQERKDSEWARQISINLSKGGVPLRYFGKLKNFKWYEQFTKDFENYNNFYKENFEPELKVKFDSLCKRDAIFTRKTMDWYYGSIEITAENASLEANAILAELKNLTDKYGFPKEQKMGYNYIKRLNRIEDYETPIIVLLIHLYKYGNRIYESDIPQFICEGILNPNAKQILKQSSGFGKSNGIEYEMVVRQEMYNIKKKKKK
jgi:hypothetical protein